MATVGNLEIDIGLKLAQLDKDITAANAAIGKFSQQTKSSLEGLTISAHGFEKGLEFLTKFALGGGLAVGLAGLVNHLEHMAEKLSDTDPRAKEFAESMERLRNVVQSGFLTTFGAINPILKDMADLAEGASHGIGNVIDKLDQAITKNRQYMAEREANRSPAEKRLNQQADPFMTGQAVAQQEAAMASEMALYGQLRQSQATLTALRAGELQKEHQARLDQAAQEAAVLIPLSDKRVDEEIRKRKEMADKAFENSVQREDDLLAVEKKNREELAKQDAAASEALNKQDLENLKRRNEQAAAFADLFTQNLVQAGELGWKSVLHSFELMLAQMILKAQAANLFKWIIGPSGISATQGGFFGFIGSLFGLAEGGPVSTGMPVLVGERGPEIFVPPTAGMIVPNEKLGGQVVQFNTTIDARGADPSAAARIQRALDRNQKATLRAVQESRRRGRL